VLSRLGLGETLERWRAVAEWDAIVGSSLARHARAVRLERDVLVVEAVSSAAMHHVSHYKRELLERNERHSGAPIVRDVPVGLQRGPERP
jgi:predicted nucleic acid-binding Zn ribbon protein